MNPVEQPNTKFVRPISERREQKFRKVIQQRQPNLTVILENVHDYHNVGAVLRSCDSVGVMEIFVLYSEEYLTKKHLFLGKKTSAGARKWVDIHYYRDVDACFKQVKSKYDCILATHLDEEAKPMHEVDYTGSIALLFGNERDGLSKEALAYADGNFIIPQMGMVESLNISVACAVTLYEAFRQRQAKGFYIEKNLLSPTEQTALYNEYRQRHEVRLENRKIKSKG